MKQLARALLLLLLLTAVFALAPAAPAAAEPPAALITLPLGVPTYKIEINADGIYEISGADLAARGMNLSTVDVRTLQMMHRGQSVATQFLNLGGGAAFEPADVIRFYGWAFDGSRYEDMHIDRNYYWLWAGGTADPIEISANAPAAGQPVVSSFPESITHWPHNEFFSGWEIPWETSPNEPTAWHWMVKDIPLAGELAGRVVKLPIAVPDPVPGAQAGGRVTVEMIPRIKRSTISSNYNFFVDMALNTGAPMANVGWVNYANVTLSGPTGSGLKQPGATGYPTNELALTFSGSSPVTAATIFITRATVEYERRLKAVGDQLQFRAAAGPAAFAVEGFSAATPAGALVWDISERTQPRAITLAAGDISGGTWTVRQTVGANGRFIATTTANIRKPLAIRSATQQAQAPAGGAQWLAITPAVLRPQAERLAAHRAAESGLSTAVIDLQQIIDQVGYGYHLPTAIQAFLRTAYTTWDTPVAYVTLFGDATVNPRGLPCLSCGAAWNTAKPHLLATDLLFIDRFTGLIPVDHTYADLLPDGSGKPLPEIAVGRIPANTLAEAEAVVSKIIRYDTNLHTVRPEQNRALFIADDTDGAGNFCLENGRAAGHLPDSFSSTQLCLPTLSQADTNALHAQIIAAINAPTGPGFVNYRGHGSVNAWASPALMRTSDAPAWQNAEPLLVVSADCLDGYFASSVTDGMGETFIRRAVHGTAAHWSSTGVGYSTEHTVLHNAFYDALFRQGLLRVGDATNYAKGIYLGTGRPESEAQSFTLLGDPAMNATAPRATISGTVQLQGRLSPLTSGTVKLIDKDGNFLEQTAVYSGSSGAYSFTEVPVAPGGSHYRLEASHREYLSSALEQTISAAPVVLPPTTLRGGDANNDGIINLQDMACLGGAFELAVSTCYGQGSSDINGDGVTNIQDLALAGGNYEFRAFQNWN
jgi:hypothetical protein